MYELENEDFEQLCQYVRRHFGIDLRKKRQLIVSRLSSTLSENGYDSFHSYLKELLSGKNPEMMTNLLNRLTTNYTYFMREESHFSFLQSTVLPELAKRHAKDRVLSVWSAGCSSGEEPYNLSMYLLEYFGALPGRWDTRVLATDISHRILGSAMNPSYPAESLAKLPEKWQKKYFLPRGDGSYTVSEQLKKNVIFRPFNLMEPIRFKIPFDLIVCRNVMIYFDQQTKDELVQRFYQSTLPGGYLFIGHSEGLSKQSCPYDYVKPAIYRKQEEGKC